MSRTQETRWTVFKDYYKGDDRLSDMWPILYGTEAEANDAMKRLKTGYDKSWFDPNGNDEAGYDAVLYVDKFMIPALSY